MNIKINSNFQFSVVSIQYTATGELSICLSSDDFSSGAHYQYSASLGNSQAEGQWPDVRGKMLDVRC